MLQTDVHFCCILVSSVFSLFRLSFCSKICWGFCSYSIWSPLTFLVKLFPGCDAFSAYFFTKRYGATVYSYFTSPFFSLPFGGETSSVIDMYFFSFRVVIPPALLSLFSFSFVFHLTPFLSWRFITRALCFFEIFIMWNFLIFRNFRVPGRFFKGIEYFRKWVCKCASVRIVKARFNTKFIAVLFRTTVFFFSLSTYSSQRQTPVRFAFVLCPAGDFSSMSCELNIQQRLESRWWYQRPPRPLLGLRVACQLNTNLGKIRTI